MTPDRSMNHAQTDSLVKLWDLIKHIRCAMFTTRDAAGHLHARPMTTRNSDLDEDSSLWFFMSRRGDTVADLSADPVVNVAYADPDDDRYVSVSGIASIVDDTARTQRLWPTPAEAWFPDGGDDEPDLVLVRVRITQANYWDAGDGRIAHILRRARAAVTGRPPSRLGRHGEVRMD